MRNLINFLRGSVHLEVSGAFPERFLNLCAQRGVSFWGVEWLGDGTVRLTVAGWQIRRLEPLAEKVRCTVTVIGKEGLPFFFWRFRKRYAFLLGLACSLTAVCVLSQFILTVEISGNQKVPTAQILAELRRQGLRVGAYGPGIDSGLVSHEALLHLEELSWMSVNLHGSRAEVLVRERVAKPEVVDESADGDIVAEAPGVITHIEVLEGEARCQEGDTVSAGDVVISGAVTLPVPEYSELEPGRTQGCARGRVYARTWRTLSAAIPLEAEVKTYTGAQESRLSLIVLGSRINFYGNSGISFPQYDKISRTWTLTLPGGRRMPLAAVWETAQEYETQTVPILQETAQSMLEERLDAALRQALEDGESVHTAYTAAVQDGMLRVTLKAECREEIGKFVPSSPQGGVDGVQARRPEVDAGAGTKESAVN